MSRLVRHALPPPAHDTKISHRKMCECTHAAARQFHNPFTVFLPPEGWRQPSQDIFARPAFANPARVIVSRSAKKSASPRHAPQFHNPHCVFLPPEGWRQPRQHTFCISCASVTDARPRSISAHPTATLHRTPIHHTGPPSQASVPTAYACCVCYHTL